MSKKILTISFFLVMMLAVAFIARAEGENTRDAIAIRVFPNKNHESPLSWYLNNISTKGAPQSLIVDGYEAVRDGRSVFVSAANIVTGTNGAKDQLFTNIYSLSYNDAADNDTIDIFGQLLNNWKFNELVVSENGTGICVSRSKEVSIIKACLKDGDCDNNKACRNHFCVKPCYLNADCQSSEYCTSKKARIIRDVKRLADLTSINNILKIYYSVNQKRYPKLESGTYLNGKTISVWPSWQETFSQAIGYQIPIDPINKLGICNSFEATTCWNENLKKFATDFKDPILPAGSYAYVYIYDAVNKKYDLCANFETDYAGLLEDARCDSYTFSDEDTAEFPEVTLGSQNFTEGAFTIYFMVKSKYDIDWDKTEITPLDKTTGSPINWASWTSAGWQWNSGTVGLKMSDTIVANQKKLTAKKVTLPVGSSYQDFRFRVKVYDIKNHYDVGESNLRICKPRDCTGLECGKIYDNCGRTLICGDCEPSKECVNNKCIEM